ncbi:MAG: T9SS type A sorting domain-containing protein [Bacteroidota bacterium]
MSAFIKVLSLTMVIALLVGATTIDLYAATRTSAATGNWSATATWGGTVPVAGDSVIIAGGFTVTVDINTAACAGMQIGSPSGGGGAGTLAFNSGSQLTVTRLVHLGNSPVRTGSVNMTSGGTLICNAITVSNLGTWTPGTGTIQFNATNTLPAQLTTYNNLIINGGTSTLGVATSLTGNLTISSGTTLAVSASNFAFNVGGNWLNNGGTFTAGTGTVTFNGTSQDTIGGSSSTAFNTLAISNSVGVRLSVLIVESANLSVTAGNFDLQTFTANRATPGGGTLTVAAGATLTIGGASNMPTNFTTHTFNATSTINYNGAAQTISSENYAGNLTLSGSGVKTLQAGTTTIGGSLSLSGTAAATTVANLAITGTLTVGTGTTLTIAGFTLGVTGATSVTGTLAFSSATGTKTFTGDVVINSGGAWTETTAPAFSFAGNFQNNGTFTSNTGVHTFTGAAKTFSGTNAISIPSVTITGTYTNNGTFTVGTALAGAGGLTQGAAATDTLNLGGTSTITTLTATGAGNTVNYNGAGQTVHGNNYYNLTLSGSGTNVLQAATTTISGNLTLSGTAVATTVANLAITGNLTVGTGTTFTVAGFNLTVTGTTSVTGTLTHSSATGTKTYTGNVIINSGGIWNDNAAAVAISFAGNLQNDGTMNAGIGVHTFTGAAKTFSGANAISIPSVTISGTYTNNGTLTVTTALAGAGGLTQGASASSILNLGGTSAITTLTATGVGNTVNYTGAAQTIKVTAYYNLTLSGSGAVTFGAITTIGGNLTLSGTVTATTAANLAVAGNLSIASGNSLTIAGFTLGVTGSTSVSGTLAFNSATGTKTFTGDVVVNSGGVWTETAAPAFSFAGNLQNDGTFTSNTGVHTFTGASKAFNGANAISIANVTITNPGAYTNNITLTVGTALSGTGSLTQGAAASSILNIGGTSGITTLTANGVGNTVNYNGAAQIVNATSYHHLTLSASGTKTMTGVSTINGNLTISGTASVTAATGMTVGGDVSVGSGTTFNTGSLSHLFGGSFSNSGTFTSTGSTITFTSTASGKTISGTLTGVDKFNNIVFNGIGGGWTFSSNADIGGTFTITNGTVTAPSGTLNVAGDFSNSGTFTHNSGTVSLNGSGLQHLGGSIPTTFNNLTMTNSSGAALTSNETISGTLTFTNGVIATGANILTAGTVTGAATGKYVNGNLQKNFPAGGPTTNTFEIGDASKIAAVSITINNVTTPGSLTANTTGSEHPSLSGSSLNSAKDVNRYWTVTNNGIAFDNYSATLNWDPTDVDGGANTANFVVAKYDNPIWTLPTSSGQTPTSISATGLTSFSDFAAGELQTYTITSSAGPNGSISPTPSVDVVKHVDQAFTITPSANYHIDSIFVDGGYVGNTSPYTFTNVTATHTINAKFAIDQFTITSSSGSNGSISPTPSLSVSYGDSAVFTFTPSTGYHVDSVYVDGVPQGTKGIRLPQSIIKHVKSYSGTTYTFYNVTTSHTIYVTFAINTFTITSSAGANGNISPTPSVDVNYGADQAFTMTPDARYHIDSIFVDGGYIGNTSPDTIKDVTTSHTIYVTFAVNVFTITSSAGPHGTISPLGPVTVIVDSNQTFTITPNYGYMTDSILVDEVSQPVAPTYTFTTVTANHTIRAAFISGPNQVSIVPTGLWSSPSTWSKNLVPSSSDSVIIAPGTIVTLDIDGICGAINVQGKLNYGNNAGRILIVSTIGSLSGSMIISDSVVFAAQASQRIFVGGDFSCTGALVNNSTGSTGSFIIFNGSGTQYLSSGAQIRGIQVNNSGADLNVTSPLTLQAGLTLTNGKVVLGNNNLTLLSTAIIGGGSASSYVVTNGAGKLVRYVTTATVAFPVGTVTGFNNVTLATQTSADTFGVRILSSVNPPSSKDSAAIQRTIDLSRSTADSVGLITMTFQWNGSEEGTAFLRNSAASWRNNGTAWVEEGTYLTPPVGSNPYVGTISNILNTGRYTLGNPGVLPITLSEFTGMTVASHTIKIDWTTVTEQNTYGFFIQRHDERSKAYTDVSDLIAGAGTSVNQLHHYSWTDAKATGGVYYYRLRTVDLNGDVEYSSEIKVNVVLGVNGQEPLVFKLSQNYPNPFNPTTTIRYSVPTSGFVSLKIYNIIGQEVATLVNNFQEANRYSVVWNAGDYSSGVYFYRIVAGANTQVMRMILVK